MFGSGTITLYGAGLTAHSHNKLQVQPGKEKKKACSEETGLESESMKSRIITS